MSWPAKSHGRKRPHQLTAAGKGEHFHAMNIFNDADTAAQLSELKMRVFGRTGKIPREQPGAAARLSEACAVLKQELLNPNGVSSLTGPLKRRIVLAQCSS